MTTARELSDRLAVLLRREHDAMADFLVALADFDGRRVWAELNPANLFSYLTRDLGLSNGAAAYRKTAAELVGRYPEVAEALRRGDLCITSVVALAKVITPENRAQVLPRFFRAADAKRKGLVANPRKTPPPSTTDRVPAHVRRAVFRRDGGRCQVSLGSGGICGSTDRVQLGHYPTPRALGGLPTLDNLRCECLSHNQEQANRDFGKPFMDQFRRRKRRR